MARGFQGAVMRGFGARDHDAVVVGTERIAPHFLRVRLRSPTLFQDAVAEPTAWLRFWFPDPDGSDTEHQRAYTLTEADEDTGEFAVDIVLHEPAGPASLWARQAEPGQSIQVMSFGSSKFSVPEEPPAGYLLIGDAASTPAINSIIAVIPADVPIELYLEQHHADDPLIPLTDHPRLVLHRFPRSGPESLAAAIEARDWSDWYVWAGPEAGSLKHLRVRLRDEFGFPKSESYQQAYWSHGRAMGKRRGEKESEPAATAAPEAVAPVVPAAEPRSAAVAEAGEPAAAAQTPADRPAKATRGSWQAAAGGRLLRPLRPTLITAGILQGLLALLQLAPFVLLVELARRLLAGDESDRLWTLGSLALSLLGAGTVLEAALLLWLHGVDARFARDLRARLLGKLARLPLGWFTARGSGGVKKVVQDDTLALHYLVTHAVPDAVAAVVAPVAVLAYLFWVDWRLGLVLLVPVLVYIVTTAIMVVQSGAKIHQAQRWAERMNGEAAAYLEGQPVVRVFGGATASSFRSRLDGYIAFLNEWQRPFIGKKTLIDIATRPGTFLWLLTAVGTFLVVDGGLDPVDLLPFLLLGTTFGARLLGIGYGLSGLRDGIVAARRLQNTLEGRELEVRAPAAAHTGTPHGRVVFDRVTFGYRPGVPVIREVSLSLEPGTVTALVGPSGSGKSTLAGLLARFHDVDDGEIRVGGSDIRELSADELYARVGFVFQDAQLVAGTVRENIALAVPDATDADVERAARDAQLHDRIVALPHGYDTVLGQDARLSGGERQRLTIARAILADTPVLILDEATAFADPESEYLVQQALNRLAAGRTVLVIAHRLHTVTGATRIVLLEDGAIAETGTHDQLFAAEGRYRRLWDASPAVAAAVVLEEATR
ncbi:ATP-binding cassette domain-containing protein [Frankia sp. CNm7]|uniref:Mycobactin import ATP-binding/permease protein IrtA n=1 Tax=Frankia nepalensis TaxID=1836974 RepID=A0A937RG67_9ACTN|nr:ABC transporter ATP-binding protein/permease [Frankia nepalensis]MBL7495737.1 ATP-binding cassette domain-containing protein [Frankia nepalensis]MBL7509011.1 ATP-binding cassette domain-containing protein [Frankia nepalensis]MBL7523690.1 ATP-binding cassette domain-containing protein [Frankia nepalensis]MBL7629810.1 ATP-binding cassette domain-containing protein [Frankia nepalensis]